jgi:hypothetical protein
VCEARELRFAPECRISRASPRATVAQNESRVREEQGSVPWRAEAAWGWSNSRRSNPPPTLPIPSRGARATALPARQLLGAADRAGGGEGSVRRRRNEEIGSDASPPPLSLYTDDREREGRGRKAINSLVGFGGLALLAADY